MNVTGFSNVFSGDTHTACGAKPTVGTYYVLFADVAHGRLVAKAAGGALVEWTDDNERAVWHGLGEYWRSFPLSSTQRYMTILRISISRASELVRQCLAIFSTVSYLLKNLGITVTMIWMVPYFLQAYRYPDKIISQNNTTPR